MAREREEIDVGVVERFPARVGVRIQVNGEELAVFRLTDGRIYALVNKSPHPKGGILCEGMVSGEYLYDPLYDWKIHLPTGKVQEPDTGMAQVVPVRIENGRVYIEVTRGEISHV